jgi:hypothetical protein
MDSKFIKSEDAVFSSKLRLEVLFKNFDPKDKSDNISYLRISYYSPKT